MDRLEGKDQARSEGRRRSTAGCRWAVGPSGRERRPLVGQRGAEGPSVDRRRRRQRMVGCARDVEVGRIPSPPGRHWLRHQPPTPKGAWPWRQNAVKRSGQVGRKLAPLVGTVRLHTVRRQYGVVAVSLRISTRQGSRRPGGSRGRELCHRFSHSVSPIEQGPVPVLIDAQQV